MTVRKIRPLMQAGYPLTPAGAEGKSEGPGVSPEAFATRFRSCPVRAESLRLSELNAHDI